jgi:peptidoglycan hydrolase CwlO-like protein
MINTQQHISRRLLLVLLATILVLTLTLPYASSTQARADDATEAMPNIVELQDKVDQASAVYDDANRRIANIEVQINATNEQIQTINSQLPNAKEKSNKAAAEYYRLMSTSNMLLDLIFGGSSFGDFLANLEYSSRMNQSYLREIGTLSALNAQLEAAQEKLVNDKKSIEEERRRAEEALLDAQFARNVAEDTARRIAEQTAAATAAAAAASEAADAAAGNTDPPVMPEPSDPGEQPSDKQAFVNQWAGRIDAYLSGSPMAGTGWIFANAAYDYNVDPRWSPAIACLESSKGRYCFLPYNAWGWGSVSWDSWESAIYGHVGGLSRGYGYTISIEAAYKYCPPNAEHWFNFVSGQMNLI